MAVEYIQPSKKIVSEATSETSEIEHVESGLPTRESRTSRWIYSLERLYRRRLVRRVSIAVALFALFALIPVIIWFAKIPKPFTPKDISCGIQGDPLSIPKNNTIRDGVQSLFTIDRTFKTCPFWQAKIYDLVWDMVVARGMFFITLWTSYVSLSSALLRVMESTPIPYDTFVGLSLNGPTVMSVYWVFRDLCRFRRFRIRLLFAGMALCMIYVFTVPTLLSVISGYIVAQASFATVPHTDQLVRTSEFFWVSTVFQKDGSDKKYCLLENDVEWEDLLRRSKMQMSCCTPTNCSRSYAGAKLNSDKEWGRVCPSSTLFSHNGPVQTDWQLASWQGSNCGFYGNESFQYINKMGETITAYCSERLEVEINNQTFDAWGPLNETHTAALECYDGRAYTYQSIADSVQCLPATDNLEYRWGFSTRLTSIVILIHLVWSICIFGLWLDAEVNGTLQKESGFQLSQLRSAFVLTAAASETTGRDVDTLIERPSEASKILSGKDVAVRFDILRKRLPFSTGDMSV